MFGQGSGNVTEQWRLFVKSNVDFWADPFRAIEQTRNDHHFQKMRESDKSENHEDHNKLTNHTHLEQILF